MQVYLPAIESYVPEEMVQAIRAFLEFCYLARRDVHDTHSLAALDDTLRRFHHHRDIFRTSGIRVNGFNLPRQHSLTHYVKLIRAFGAPNGLCSSITESKHIKAVKEPWRRSNRFEALGQMLLINQRLDKLAAARANFASRGMLKTTYSLSVWDQILRAYFDYYILITFITNFTDTNEAESHLFVRDEGALDGNANIKPGGKQHNDDDDDVDVDGPKVEAHVDLSKIACKYTSHHSILRKYTHLHGQYAKFTPKTLKLNSLISLISSRNLSTTSSIQMIAPIAVFQPSLHFLA